MRLRSLQIIRNTSVVSILLVIFSACAPIRTAYYKPIGPGSYFKSQCGGPDNYLGYEVVDGLGIMVLSQLPKNARLPSILIQLYPGEGHTLKLVSPEFQIIDQASGDVMDLSVKQMFYLDENRSVREKKLEISPIDEVNGVLLPPALRSVLYKEFQNYRAYNIILDTGEIPYRKFLLRFPHAMFDHKPIDLPDVKVEYREEIFFYFIC